MTQTVDVARVQRSPVGPHWEIWLHAAGEPDELWRIYPNKGQAEDAATQLRKEGWRVRWQPMAGRTTQG